MNAKRIICLLLSVVTVFSMAACGTGSHAAPADKNTQTQGTQGTQNTQDTTQSTEPQLVMPDAPTDALEMMEYNAAYETLTDVSDQVNVVTAGIPSSQAVTVNSVTEFFTQEDLQGFVTQFADVGYTKNITATIEGNSFNLQYNILTGNNRYFFLANQEYSAHLYKQVSKVVYNAETASLYFLLDYIPRTYADDENATYYYADVANHSQTVYTVVAFNFDGGFDENVEHIVFVDPEKETLCRKDINVSIVPYDEKYQEYAFFDYASGGVSPRLYSFPPTQVPAENDVTLITSKEVFLELEDTYNDIVDRADDTVIFEPYLVHHTHRTNGLSNASDTGALLNILIASPELDAYSAMRCEYFFVPISEEKTYFCGQFYDEETQTVYIYIGYNGQPHSQYEKFSDKALIEANSQATYAMMSISFSENAMNIVKNIVIVLPDPATVSAN